MLHALFMIVPIVLIAVSLSMIWDADSRRASIIWLLVLLGSISAMLLHFSIM